MMHGESGCAEVERSHSRQGRGASCRGRQLGGRSARSCAGTAMAADTRAALDMARIPNAAGLFPAFKDASWLTKDGLERYRLDKAIQIAQVVMSRRNQNLCSATEQLLGWVCEEARKGERAGWG